MWEAVFGLAGAIVGVLITATYEALRQKKLDRERWENHLRASYGMFLNRIFDYPRAEKPAEWRDSYKHSHAQMLLSAPKEVAQHLLRPPLVDPPDPRPGEQLIDETQYTELVSAMRLDVVPPLRREA